MEASRAPSFPDQPSLAQTQLQGRERRGTMGITPLRCCEVGGPPFRRGGDLGAAATAKSREGVRRDQGVTGP